MSKFFVFCASLANWTVDSTRYIFFKCCKLLHTLTFCCSRLFLFSKIPFLLYIISIRLMDSEPQNGESLHCQTCKKFSRSVKRYLHIYSVYLVFIHRPHKYRKFMETERNLLISNWQKRRVVIKILIWVIPLRDRWRLQNGGIFVPSGLWPATHFQKIMWQFFLQFHAPSPF